MSKSHPRMSSEEIETNYRALVELWQVVNLSPADETDG